MESSLAELNAKIDRLTAQVDFLAEQARVAAQQRDSQTDFVHGVMPAVNGAYNFAVEQLQEVEPYVDLDDALRLLKRLLRNRETFERLLDQVESVADLMDVANPIVHGVYDKTVDAMTALERKGYFMFARGGLEIVDNVVTSFSEEDVKQLGANVVLILQTIKDITQPEMMNFTRNFVASVEAESNKEVDISYGALLGLMRDANVRRGLALTMRVLRTLGEKSKPASFS